MRATISTGIQHFHTNRRKLQYKEVPDTVCSFKSNAEIIRDLNTESGTSWCKHTESRNWDEHGIPLIGIKPYTHMSNTEMRKYAPHQQQSFSELTSNNPNRILYKVGTMQPDNLLQWFGAKCMPKITSKPSKWTYVINTDQHWSMFTARWSSFKKDPKTSRFCMNGDFTLQVVGSAGC